jgi:hypothetical protein
MPVNDRALHIEVPIEGNARMLRRQEPAEGPLANLDCFPAEVDAVEREEIKGAKRHGMVIVLDLSNPDLQAVV